MRANTVIHQSDRCIKSNMVWELQYVFANILCMLSATFHDQGRWHWPFRGPHQVHSHFMQPWPFIYYPCKWPFLSGCWWYQFPIIINPLENGNCLPGTESLKSPFRTEFSIRSLSQHYRWSLWWLVDAPSPCGECRCQRRSLCDSLNILKHY